MSDRADPWAGTTYNGFAGLAELPPPAPSRPRISRNLLLLHPKIETSMHHKAISFNKSTVIEKKGNSFASG